MSAIEEKVLKALDEIRPYLHSDGGDIELVAIEDEVVKIKFLGNCMSCSINKMTLKSGVEMTIKQFAPEIQEVIQIDG